VTGRLKALGAVGVAVAVVAVAFVALSRGDGPTTRTDGTDDSGRTERTARRMPPAPQDLPAEGLYVVSDVAEDGSVEVQTWLRAAQPVSELALTTTDPDLLPGSVESLDLVVRAMDGAMLAHRESVGTNPQRVRLRRPVSELYFTYVVDGGMDEASATVEGRSLARVLAMDVDYAGAGGVVRRVVTASGTVLNVACLRPSEDFEAAPRPCGKATGDGDWVVDLQGDDWHDRLLAQLEG
jgi:hypothetical protein